MSNIFTMTNNSSAAGFLLLATTLLSLIFVPILAYAQEPGGSATKPLCSPEDIRCQDPAHPQSTAPGNCTGKGADCGIFTKYIDPFIYFLSGFAGIAVTIGIVWGAVQYTSAGSDPGAVAKARAKIRNSLIAFIVFLFTLALLNWLVPGGL